MAFSFFLLSFFLSILESKRERTQMGGEGHREREKQTPWAWGLVWGLILGGPLINLSSFKKFFYLFVFCLGWFLLPCRSLICSSAAFNLLLSPSCVFLILVIVFFSSDSFFFIFSLCWSSHWIHAFFSQVCWAFLWPVLWTLYQIDHLSLFHLVIVLKCRIVLSFGTYSSISSFCLTSWVYFCNCSFQLFPSLKYVALNNEC